MAKLSELRHPGNSPSWLLSPNYSWRLRVAKFWGRSVAEEVVAEYVRAIEKCLRANREDGDDAKSEEDQCRAVIRDAVADLEEAWSTAYATKGDPNQPKELKVPRGVLKRKASNTQNSPAKRNGSVKVVREQLSLPTGYQTTSSPNGLFDVTRLKILGDCVDSRCGWAKTFLERAESFYNKHIHHLPIKNRIRVAILDTGIDDTKVFFRAAKKNRTKRDSPVMDQKSFLAGISVTDTDGHGTNVAAIVLKMAPEADLYVAKISKGHEVDGTHHIADAIDWAIAQDVHIINMSFGLSSPNWNIKAAIRRAESLGIICTAAASNYGSNQARSFPAKLDQVLCIHAGDGNGNKSGLNPTPLPWRDNLSTLGVCIPSVWEDEDEGDHYISGTSYAAPVAAGIAANVLRDAHSCSGMRHIMLAMCEPQHRDGYWFVIPWRRIWSEDSTESDVVSKMKEALKNV
ncbi:Subtilisin-like protein [Fusarium keratoplasticum]|nr:Subtilisin-like protein [Fusarium keratoplasticum]